MVTRPMAYQVAMPRSGMDNQRTILNIIARDETRLDTLSDDGMPCEMDNQLQGEILYLEEPIQIQIHVFEKCKYKMTVCPMKWTMKRTINYVGGEIPYLEKQIENLI